MDFEFPFYRASVDEGLGLASEGNYEYTCDNCKFEISVNRFHAKNKDNYDLCPECFVKLKKTMPEVKFFMTQGSESNAENLEADRSAKKIINDYCNNLNDSLIHFNNFLRVSNLNDYTLPSVNNYYIYLRKFNSFTLNSFLQSKFNFKNKPKKLRVKKDKNDKPHLLSCSGFGLYDNRYLVFF